MSIPLVREKIINYKNNHYPFDMKSLFTNNPNRFNDFSLSIGDLLVDFSKNLITKELWQLLLELAEQSPLTEKIDAMFSGKCINLSENKPALHTALRRPKDAGPIYVDHQDIMPAIHDVLARMRKFSEQIRANEYLGATGRRINKVVNISIGGSNLGPEMITTALESRIKKFPDYDFVSNVDAMDIRPVLESSSPEHTLFIIASKSFTTQETMTNADTAKKWLADHIGEQGLAKHFVALTANVDEALAFGVLRENIFEFWPWVGGRFSGWSSIGLVIAIIFGMDVFCEVLQGAYLMDEHFRTTPFEKNMPVILALLGIWYSDFLGASHHGVVCYNQSLRAFPRYLQQIDMESNGKCVLEDGSSVSLATAPIVFGDCGTQSQHSFHQLLHQGTHLIPVDFILPINGFYDADDHQNPLIANCFAQSQALLMGRSREEVYQKLTEQGLDAQQASQLAAHKAMPGNRPSNTILFPSITPQVLGQLMALYEHKIFVQGVLWGINSFDQWGVELGKVLANNIQPIMERGDLSHYDASTRGLIDFYRQHKLTLLDSSE